jgi:hypothetical protein
MPNERGATSKLRTIEKVSSAAVVYTKLAMKDTGLELECSDNKDRIYLRSQGYRKGEQPGVEELSESLLIQAPRYKGLSSAKVRRQYLTRWGIARFRFKTLRDFAIPVPLLPAAEEARFFQKSEWLM